MLWNNFKTFILLAGLTALLVGAGTLLGGRHGMAIALTFGVLMNLAGYWFSDKLALAMSGAIEVGPREAGGLYATVERLAACAGLPMPRVYVIPQRQPNAFATGRNPANAAVAVTEGLLQALDQRELEGVLAHELAHVKNRDILISSVAAMLAGSLSQLANMALFFGGRDEDGPGLAAELATMIVAPFAAMLVQMAISRSREFEADRVGAAITGDPLGLARALDKIERYAHAVPLPANPGMAHMYIISPGAVLKLFSTHPPTEERIARLEALVG
jgi:heat shock protein HtpX